MKTVKVYTKIWKNFAARIWRVGAGSENRVTPTFFWNSQTVDIEHAGMNNDRLHKAVF